MPDANLEKSLDWFGGKNTQRVFCCSSCVTPLEHLDQSIAYARFIDVHAAVDGDVQKSLRKRRKRPRRRNNSRGWRWVC